jgi:hypothetical protein
MQAVEVSGNIDEQHRLSALVPNRLPAGPVRLIVLWSGDEDGGASDWARLIRAEWAEELSDPREDIYTLEDGQPLNAAG